MEKYVVQRLYVTDRSKCIIERITFGTQPKDFQNYKIFLSYDNMLGRIKRSSLTNSLFAGVSRVDAERARGLKKPTLGESLGPTAASN